MTELYFSFVNASVALGAMAAIQGYLLYRLNIPYISGPIFFGLGCYAGLHPSYGLQQLVFLIILLITCFYLVAVTQRKLKPDHFLVANLAIAELVVVLIGSDLAAFGGRTGLIADTEGGVSEAGTLYAVSLPLILCTIFAFRFLASTNFDTITNLAISNRRIAKSEFPIAGIELTCLLVASVICLVLGYVFVDYRGGISPAIFTPQFLFVALGMSIFAMKGPALALFMAITVSALPYAVSLVLGPSMNSYVPPNFGAELVNLLWASAILFVIIRIVSNDR